MGLAGRDGAGVAAEPGTFLAFLPGMLNDMQKRVRGRGEDGKLSFASKSKQLPRFAETDGSSSQNCMWKQDFQGCTKSRSTR